MSRKYKIIEGWDCEDLEEEINDLVAQGWAVDGEMVIVVNLPQGFWERLSGMKHRFRYFQRMVKP